ncbi:hypothetical protein [Microbulbifer sp. ANSA005]|uniref:hypothetical protein n=1 Tax=Microbulbifer sp. ANSA005 TaxID=3243362 RepID=UPI004041C3C2
MKPRTYTYWHSKQSKRRPKLIPVTIAAFQASVDLTLPDSIQMQLPVSELAPPAGATLMLRPKQSAHRFLRY